MSENLSDTEKLNARSTEELRNFSRKLRKIEMPRALELRFLIVKILSSRLGFLCEEDDDIELYQLE